jgi:ubiquinone biosynthesis protein COQ9
MLDLTTPRGRILKAALDVAAEKPWADVALADVAARADLGLDGLRSEVASKADLLSKLLRAIDDAVLKTAPRPSAELSKRDALFEVIMARFDLLGPYKPALKSIHASGAADFSLAAPYLASQHWMLQAAGIATDGLAGGARVAGLALAYASVFRTWLGDEDPGLGKTMAALDRQLRRGESAMQNLEKTAGFLGRMGKAFGEAAKAAAASASARRAAGPSAPAPEPAPYPAAAATSESAPPMPPADGKPAT